MKVEDEKLETKPLAPVVPKPALPPEETEEKEFDAVETNGKLADEYNPDDEIDESSFGYGWSYDENLDAKLDSPEEVEKEEELFDEDAEYAQGKPVGYDLDDSGND